jgi:dTDP-4-dehydrorhamnose 3,5-epimerase
MKFTETPLTGAYVIDPEPHRDERGLFERVFCRQEFEAHSLEPAVAQCNVCFNPRKGTLRGMHYQVPPHEEVKLVRCTSGAIYDVIVDLRRGSPTHAKWFGVELTADGRRQLYIPRLFAHGYITLADDTEVFYQVSEPYHPEFERGLRFDDPALAIRWPLAPTMVSAKDRNHPMLTP